MLVGRYMNKCQHMSTVGRYMVESMSTMTFSKISCLGEILKHYDLFLNVFNGRQILNFLMEILHSDAKNNVHTRVVDQSRG